MEKVFIAADLGGTNLRMAAVDSVGNILSRDRRATPSQGDQADIIEAIVGGVEDFQRELTGDYEFAGFGAAMPAIVNSNSGVILRSPNLPQLNDLEFSKVFS